MSLDDLLKGFQALDEGLTKFAVGRGVAQAQEQVNQINSSQMKELERRQALSGIANQLTMQLTQAGANPNQVAQAAGAVMPSAIKNSGDFLTQAALTGDQELAGRGQQLQQQENAVQTGENAKNRSNQLTIAREGNASSEKIAGMQIGAASQRAAEKKLELPRQAFDKFSTALGNRQMLVELMDKWKSDPKVRTYVGLRGKDIAGARKYFNENLAAFQAEVAQAFNEYRKSITGAAASDKELVDLRTSLFNVDNSPESFEAILKRTLDVNDAKFKAQIKPYASKFDTSMFELDRNSLVPEQAQQQQRDNSDSVPAHRTASPFHGY